MKEITYLKNNDIIIKDRLIDSQKEIDSSNKGRVIGYIYATENEKLFIDLTISKHIFQILENLIKVFMYSIMFIDTSQEIISEMKKHINIKKSNLDKVISKAIEDRRDLDINNIVVSRKRIISE